MNIIETDEKIIVCVSDESIEEVLNLIKHYERLAIGMINFKLEENEEEY